MTFLVSIHRILLISAVVSLVVATAPAESDPVSVVFYGESQCPMCRNFVTNVWQEIWTDEELMAYVDYDFIAWGNAYFVTEKCGSGPYSAQERACWYQECITSTSDNDDECFGGEVVYQHSKKEGDIDIYEMCVKLHFGLASAVDFTYCCEGDRMDDENLSSKDLMMACLPLTANPSVIQNCFETQGHAIEVSSAKHTPVHPGVPYVLVDGVALDDPSEVRSAICKRLEEKGNEGSAALKLPKSCNKQAEK